MNDGRNGEDDIEVECIDVVVRTSVSIISSRCNGSNASDTAGAVSLFDRVFPIGGLDNVALKTLFHIPPPVDTVSSSPPLITDDSHPIDRGIPINPENGSIGSSHDTSIKSSPGCGGLIVNMA